MPPQNFSDELIERGQSYFEKRCGVKASKGEMDLWLDSLADFYGLLREIRREKTTQ